MRTYSWQGSGGSLNDQYDVTVKVSSISTVSGAPSSVTVATPVVDMQASVSAQVSCYPAVGTLEWRASNIPFSPGDSSPAWSNPVGEYRYWQARVTWTNPAQLVECIAFDAQRVSHILTVPCVGRNVELWHADGTFPCGGAKGVASLERVPSGDGWQLDSQRLITVDR